MNLNLNKWLLFASIALGPFMVGIDFLGIGVATEPISIFFHAKISVLQWVISAYAIGCSSLTVYIHKEQY